MELEHGGDGRIAADPLFERVAEYCRNTHVDGKPILEDARVRDLLADMLIELNTLRRFNQLIYWRRFAKKPHPYGGPQQRYYQRMLRLRTVSACKRSWEPTLWSKIYRCTKWIDFEYAVRTGPGQLHGGGTTRHRPVNFRPSSRPRPSQQRDRAGDALIKSDSLP
jgi:hypothetical protein